MKQIEHLELWRFEAREAQRDAWDAQHEQETERAFDGEDAEEWQRRSEEQLTYEEITQG